MNTNIAELYKTNPIKACRLALRRTVNIPEYARLDAICELLGGYGKVAITGEWQKGYWCDVVAVYVDMGDTYSVTVLQVRGEYSFMSSKFIISSFGDWVEKNEARYNLH